MISDDLNDIIIIVGLFKNIMKYTTDKENTMRKLVLILMLVVVTFGLSGCVSNAEVVSENISKEAEQFRVKREISFINLFDSSILFTMTGNCSVDKDTEDQQLEVTCKIGKDEYQKHFLDVHEGANVTYTVIQLEFSDVSPYDFEFIFKPESIIPVDIITETSDSPE